MSGRYIADSKRGGICAGDVPTIGKREAIFVPLINQRTGASRRDAENRVRSRRQRQIGRLSNNGRIDDGEVRNGTGDGAGRVGDQDGIKALIGLH